MLTASATAPGALLLTTLLLATNGAQCVRITSMRVPPAVRNGSSHTILDCEYVLKPEEADLDRGLVVKWYFNNGPTPVYQWIPGGRPQDLGVLKGKLNLNHRVSDHRATKHRALYIVNPTTELSGEYKCHVSTFESEDFMIKRMVVFVPGRELEVWGSPLGAGGGVNVTCRGRGVFPEPQLALFLDHAELPGVAVQSTARDGVYDVSASALLPYRDPEATTDGGQPPAPQPAPAPAPEPSDDGPALVNCRLRIPDVDFTASKTYIYYKGNKDATNDSGAGPPGRPPLLLGALALKVLLTALVLRPAPAPAPATAPAPAPSPS